MVQVRPVGFVAMHRVVVGLVSAVAVWPATHDASSCLKQLQHTRVCRRRFQTLISDRLEFGRGWTPECREGPHHSEHTRTFSTADMNSITVWSSSDRRLVNNHYIWPVCHGTFVNQRKYTGWAFEIADRTLKTSLALKDISLEVTWLPNSGPSGQGTTWLVKTSRTLYKQ